MEPNDSIALATVTGLMPGETLRLQEPIGNLTFQNFAQTAPSLDVDFYKVDMEIGDILSLSFSPVGGSSLNPGIRIFDQNGTPLLTEFALPRFDFIAPASASYFVAVSSKDNVSYNPQQILSGTPLIDGTAGNYNLSLTLHPGDFASEPNNTIGTAIFTGLSTKNPGSLVKSGYIDGGDADLFQFSLDRGDRVRIKTQTLRESSLDTFLRLFDDTGRLLVTNDDANPGTRDSFLEYVAPRTGTYVIGLSDRSNISYSPTNLQSVESSFEGGYIFSIEVEGAPPEIVIDDVFSNALATGLSSAIPGEKVFNGSIGNNPQTTRGLDRDLYSLEMSAGDKLILTIDTAALSELDSVIRVFDGGGREVAFNDDAGGSKDSVLEFIAPVSGKFVVGVSDFNNNAYNPFVLGSGTPGNTGSYRLTMNLTGEIPLEPNDSLIQAKPIGLSRENPGVTIREYIGNNPFLPAELDVDFYKLDLSAGRSISATVSTLALSSGLIPGVKILDDSGRVLAEDRSASVPQLADQFKQSSLTFTPLSSGTYFLVVSDVDNFAFNPQNAASGDFRGSIGSYSLAVGLNS